MRDVISAPVPGLDLRREYGHHQTPAIRAGGLIFCSGMVAINPQTGEREHGTVTSETRRIFENLKLLLEPAGSSLDRLVQVHAMIYDRIEYDVLNRAYRQYVASPPARTVMSARIEAGFKVMLDVIAAAETRERAPAVLSRQVIASAPNLGLPLSPAIRAGDFVFVSGMVASEPATGGPRHGTVAAQTRQILTDMAQLLEAAGSSLAEVVKVNVLMYSMLEYENMNSVYREFFPDDPPARTVCGATLIGGHKVEIDCMALASETRPVAMTEPVPRSVIEPANPKLNVSRSANLPHSPGIRVGDYIFLSGMGPVDPVTGGRNLGPIADQILQTLRNIAHMLESAGSALDRIVKMTVVLADAEDYDEMNRVWREFFPVEAPARTTCALQLSNGNGVEIECVALAGKSPA